ASRPWRTAHSAAPPASTSASLQCGHGQPAVENGGVGGAVDLGLTSFNAATASRPWRTGKAAKREQVVAALKCEQGQAAVENRSRCKRCISRWLERAVRAGGEVEGQKKQMKQCLIR